MYGPLRQWTKTKLKSALSIYDTFLGLITLKLKAGITMTFGFNLGVGIQPLCVKTASLSMKRSSSIFSASHSGQQQLMGHDLHVLILIRLCRHCRGIQQR